MGNPILSGMALKQVKFSLISRNAGSLPDSPRIKHAFVTPLLRLTPKDKLETLLVHSR